MTRIVIHADAAPTSAFYSQAVKAGGLIFAASQGPIDPTNGQIVGITIQEQTAQCLKTYQPPSKLRVVRWRMWSVRRLSWPTLMTLLV